MGGAGLLQRFRRSPKPLLELSVHRKSTLDRLLRRRAIDLLSKTSIRQANSLCVVRPVRQEPFPSHKWSAT